MEKGKLLRWGTERVQEFLLRIEYFSPSSQSLEIIKDWYTHYIWKYGVGKLRKCREEGPERESPTWLSSSVSGSSFGYEKQAIGSWELIPREQLNDCVVSDSHNGVDLS